MLCIIMTMSHDIMTMSHDIMTMSHDIMTLSHGIMTLSHGIMRRQIFLKGKATQPHVNANQFKIN